MVQTFSHMLYGPKQPRDAAFIPRTIMNLDLCNYQEKQANFKNKYLWPF
jgi:hypothetical protein